MERNIDNNSENETQQNLMKIVEYLATDVFKPVSENEIGAALDIPEAEVLWALQNLAIRGWTEQAANGWRLAPRIVKIAELVRISLKEAIKRYLA
jgi:DNA-binding IclR family transcriptional regulator